jgi:hypothetical protein
MIHFQGPFSIDPIHIIIEAIRWILAFLYETPSIFYLIRFFSFFPRRKENPRCHPISSVLIVRTYGKKAWKVNEMKWKEMGNEV